VTASDLTEAIERIEATVSGLQVEVMSMRDAINRIAVGIKGDYGSKGIEARMEAYEQLEDMNNRRLAVLEEWRAKTLAIVSVAVASVSVVATIMGIYKVLVP